MSAVLWRLDICNCQKQSVPRNSSCPRACGKRRNQPLRLLHRLQARRPHLLVAHPLLWGRQLLRRQDLVDRGKGDTLGRVKLGLTRDLERFRES